MQTCHFESYYARFILSFYMFQIAKVQVVAYHIVLSYFLCVCVCVLPFDPLI